MAVTQAVTFEQPRDYRDELKAPSDHVRLLAVAARRYLMVDGDGEPGSQAFRDAIGSLYPVAYTLHFALKRRGIDAPVGALEGLFWIGEPGPTAISELTAFEQRNDWQWRLLLPVPDAASAADVTAAIDEAGLHLRGCHHELYIGDPNRTRPERLKTIIRQLSPDANRRRHRRGL